uniref:Uncharacterized protein n=1 Tax=Romanomermis culicivorax TaxID=13658 RepID=A0A915KHU9_ROMCU
MRVAIYSLLVKYSLEKGNVAMGRKICIIYTIIHFGKETQLLTFGSSKTFQVAGQPDKN